MHKHPFFYIYILKCADNTYYVGVTNNLDRRIEEHESGNNPGSYTSSRLPVELVYYTQFTEPETAFEFEARIKKWSRAKKEALINGEYEKLPSLSRKQFKNCNVSLFSIRLTAATLPIPTRTD
jgi:putative endonuclease